MTNGKTISIEIPVSRLEELNSFYQHELVLNKSPYVFFSANHDGISIIAYKPKPGHKAKVVFQGHNPLSEAQLWDPLVKEPKEVISEVFSSGWVDIGPQIGSDEVGTGDFFGPVTVVACYVDPKLLEEIDRLGITDSKKMNDERILKIIPSLLKQVNYSSFSVDNDKYNKAIASGLNMNSIKAILHHQALVNLKNKIGKSTPIYIDQFCSPTLFYKYLKDVKQPLKNITFKTKAEVQFPSVALASVFARYSFLKKMEIIEKKYGVKIPLGSGSHVPVFAKEFIKKYGYDAYCSIVKQNFKTHKQIVIDLGL